MIVGLPKISERSYTMLKALFWGNALKAVRTVKGKCKLKTCTIACSGWQAHNLKPGKLNFMEAISFINQHVKGFNLQRKLKPFAERWLQFLLRL